MSEQQRNNFSNLRLGYLNNVIIMGRVTADADLRYTPKGTPVCSFRIAVNRRYRDEEEWKEETYFFAVNVWARQAERLSERLKKGTAVLITGELRSRNRDTATGEKRTDITIYGRNVQILDRIASPGPEESESNSLPSIDDEPDIPKDQLDDIPF
ncbi:MAG: single-stranded DNA-binding protein [bacterium]